MLTKMLDTVRSRVRTGARIVARILNRVSGGKLTPNTVTIIGLLGHLPIAWLIATRHPLWAGALLVIFGLMDTLDGELARLQQRASPGGMLLDASTDRMKEVLLYTASAYFFIEIGQPYFAVAAVAACGGSLLVSYVKAKGETAIVAATSSHHQANYLFADGLMRYEVRMFALLVGLLSGYLGIAIAVLAVSAWLTAFGRLIRIMRFLGHVQN